MQRFLKWYGITIPCIKQDAILIVASTAKVFYIKIKNSNVKTELVPRLHIGDGLYAGNALVKNRGGRYDLSIVDVIFYIFPVFHAKLFKFCIRIKNISRNSK